MKTNPQVLFTEKRLRTLSIVIILLGITLRLVFYFQDRSLFIDEANVARNIYERSFSALCLPLSYEQYAPPLFLWIIKCFTLLLGYGEYSYRLFSLVCGIATLWLMYVTLKKYCSYTVAWYPLIIMATGFIYIRYSAELKQYMCDAMVVLLLLIAALKISFENNTNIKFVALWALLGSVTIWLSMPGVFMLAGVGAYYAYIALRQKLYTKLPALVGVALIWLGQFCLYYFLILKPQINSDYLQNCHKDFFLYLLPTSMAKLDHNADVFVKALSAMGGKWTIPEFFHIMCLVVGWVVLFRKHTAKAILVSVPIACLVLAASINQYALTPRLIIFIFPLLLIIIAVGFQQLLQVKFVAVKAILVIVACICFYLSNTLDLFYKRYDNEQITESLNYLKKEQITGDHLLVHNLAMPAYIYYTTIHPNKKEWQAQANATFLHWNTNYDSLAQAFKGRTAMLYSWAPDDEWTHNKMI